AKSCWELLARGVVLSDWYTVYPWDCPAAAVLYEMDMDGAAGCTSDSTLSQARDSLAQNKNILFSTKDGDNSAYSSNCTVTYK
ncbi:PREDICTED: ficolin-2-like, partial [Cariama cristata]|uniref:ficolin-2-like n=1 Tax=Cariama cristata TaxID=54380 RepID=UPI0005208EAF